MSAGQAGSARLCWEGVFNQKGMSPGPCQPWGLQLLVPFHSITSSSGQRRSSPLPPQVSHLLLIPRGSLGAA